MTDEKQKDPRTVQLRRVRLSFTDGLFEKRKTSDDENAKPKHTCNVILEKDQPHFADNKNKIMDGIRAAGDRAWKNEDAYKGIQEDSPKRVCFRPGERFKNKDGKPYAGYEGNFGLTCGTPGAGQKRPKMYDRVKRNVAETDILDVCYGGSYADVVVSFYGTDKGSRGIFCVIEAIRSHQEGERMGGGGWDGDADDFDDLEDAEDAFAGTASADSDPLG